MSGLRSTLIVLIPLLASCPKAPDKGPSEAPPRPSSAIAFDPKAQIIEPGLKDAYQAIDGGRHDTGRRMVAAYLKIGGTRQGQAEFLLGFAAHKQDLYEEALTHFARAVQLEPTYVATYYYQGFALFQLGHMDDARKAYEIYLGAQPDRPNAHFGLGLVALEQDRIDEAAKYIGRASELERMRARIPKFKDDAERDIGRYLARMADVKLRQEDLNGARDMLRESVKLVPDIPDVWNKLSRVLVRLGDDAMLTPSSLKMSRLSSAVVSSQFTENVA